MVVLFDRVFVGNSLVQLVHKGFRDFSEHFDDGFPVGEGAAGADAEEGLSGESSDDHVLNGGVRVFKEGPAADVVAVCLIGAGWQEVCVPLVVDGKDIVSEIKKGVGDPVGEACLCRSAGSAASTVSAARSGDSGQSGGPGRSGGSGQLCRAGRPGRVIRAIRVGREGPAAVPGGVHLVAFSFQFYDVPCMRAALRVSCADPGSSIGAGLAGVSGVPGMLDGIAEDDDAGDAGGVAEELEGHGVALADGPAVEEGADGGVGLVVGLVRVLVADVEGQVVVEEELHPVAGQVLAAAGADDAVDLAAELLLHPVDLVVLIEHGEGQAAPGRDLPGQDGVSVEIHVKKAGVVHADVEDHVAEGTDVRSQVAGADVDLFLPVLEGGQDQVIELPVDLCLQVGAVVFRSAFDHAVFSCPVLLCPARDRTG